MKNRLLLFLVALTLLAGGCEVATSKTRRAVSDVDAMFTNRAIAKIFAGSVLIARDGVVQLSKGYGQADIEKGLPCTPQTKYRIASMTKQFTAMAILLLEAGGALHVEDGISTYIRPCPDAWKSITIHHLLTHTSGMPDLASYLPTVSQTIDLLRGKPLDFAPGSKFQYSNSGYMLLGAIIEKVAGIAYEDFLLDKIFTPLGMTGTGYDHGGPDLAVNNTSYGMKADVSTVPAFFSAGALYSSAEDLYRWDQALSSDALVPMPYIEKMFTAYAPITVEGGSRFSYGYGWILESTANRFSQWHVGEYPGISTIIARYPAEKLTIIILSNMTADVASYAEAVEKAFLGELPTTP